MSTNWDAIRTGSLDELAAAVMDRMSNQRDDPSSREQEMADACLALIERCKAALAQPKEPTRCNEEGHGEYGVTCFHAAAQPEERGELDHHGCAFSGPGRGDCEHAVGLPGTPISGQHDGPDDTVDVYGRPNGWCWWCWHMRQIRLATEPEERGAEWREEGEEPTSPGWYAVQRKDGSLCLRAFGQGLWWIPLRDGWLSGIPAGFKWLGPVEPVEWDSPRSLSPPAPSPSPHPEEKP